MSMDWPLISILFSSVMVDLFTITLGNLCEPRSGKKSGGTDVSGLA